MILQPVSFPFSSRRSPLIAGQRMKNRTRTTLWRRATTPECAARLEPVDGLRLRNGWGIPWTGCQLSMPAFCTAKHRNSDACAGLAIFGPPTSDTDIFATFRDHLKSRLHLVPFFQRKLAMAPIQLDHPVWVHDENLDLDYHFRHVSLPKTGNARAA